MPEDDDKTCRPINIEENKCFFKIRFLLPKTTYFINFFNTKTGKYDIRRTKVKTNRRGIAKVYAPEMLWEVNPDIAFTIEKIGDASASPFDF